MKSRTRQGSSPRSDKVSLVVPLGSPWGIIIRPLGLALEILETSWDEAVREAWQLGFRRDIVMEDPDVRCREYALYLLE